MLSALWRSFRDSVMAARLFTSTVSALQFTAIVSFICDLIADSAG